jgi:hypothetical protein
MTLPSRMIRVMIGLVVYKYFILGTSWDCYKLAAEKPLYTRAGSVDQFITVKIMQAVIIILREIA